MGICRRGVVEDGVVDERAAAADFFAEGTGLADVAARGITNEMSDAPDSVNSASAKISRASDRALRRVRVKYDAREGRVSLRDEDMICFVLPWVDGAGRGGVPNGGAEAGVDDAAAAATDAGGGGGNGDPGRGEVASSLLLLCEPNPGA
jgi:hypothetical protein